MRDRREVEELKRAANGRMHDVLQRLGITAQPNRAGLILISNPRVKDNDPSFAIWTKGGFVAWKYFSAGDKGDIIDLVSYLNGWWDLPERGFVEAARWLEDCLGMRRLTPAQRAADQARAKAAQEKAAKDGAEELERGRRWARAVFYNALPIADTPVQAYLWDRGIDFTWLPRGPRGGWRKPGAVRYLPDHKHVGEGGAVTHWPCMVVCFTDIAGDIKALHRTWLAVEKGASGKAPVKPPRKAYPEVGGLFLPLWRGESGLSVREACACGLRETLVLTEGVEDGFSAVLGAPQYRTWGAYSLSNLANLAAVLPDCIDAVMIHRQNDWAKLQAVEAFERAKAAIEATGRPVSEIAAHAGGKDLNDMLRS